MKHTVYVSMIMILVILLCIQKELTVSSKVFNLMMILGLIVFVGLSTYDSISSLLFITIFCIMLSKIRLKLVKKETFKKKKKTNKKSLVANEATKTSSKNKDKSSLKKQATKSVHVCKDIKSLDEDFLKEFHTNSKNLQSIQNNVFDKYNYNVYYNELGENSVDIQGILNHEVQGYEVQA